MTLVAAAVAAAADNRRCAICRRRWTKLERLPRRPQRQCSTKRLIPV